MPNAANNVYIGSNDYPTGAAFNAIVALTQNQSANEVWLGYQGGDGTLDLANSVLFANNLYVGTGGGVGAVTRGTGSFQVGGLNVSNATVALSPSDVITSTINLVVNGSISNDGALNIQSWEAFISSASLHDGNDSIGAVLLLGSQIHVTDTMGQQTGLTISDFHASALNISSDSKLILDIDGQGSDWIFRWANPNDGDHIADLTNLIALGRIELNNPGNLDYQIYSSSDGFTYVTNAVPEPSTLLLIGAVGVGSLAYYRRHRKLRQSREDILIG